ncbi:hypothetical protein PANA5342_3315 [Pantoea ananatis LMG 5342]|nr:hypothetical protein PANA5342_3315 [Pantoea ananatis LMG 5342]
MTRHRWGCFESVTYPWSINHDDENQHDDEGSSC